MRKMLVLGGCLAAALMLGGCKSTDTIYISDSLGPPYRWVQSSDEVKEFVKVFSARQDRQNGLLRVQVDLHNTLRSQKRIVYRFVWMDEKGIEVSSIQNEWTSKIMGSGETVQLTGIAPEPRVTQCIVKLQESER